MRLWVTTRCFQLASLAETYHSVVHQTRKGISKVWRTLYTRYRYELKQLNCVSMHLGGFPSDSSYPKIYIYSHGETLYIEIRKPIRLPLSFCVCVYLASAQSVKKGISLSILVLWMLTMLTVPKSTSPFQENISSGLFSQSVPALLLRFPCSGHEPIDLDGFLAKCRRNSWTCFTRSSISVSSLAQFSSSIRQ